MALIIESVLIRKTAVSIQIKVHEVYVKPLNPREPISSIKDSDDDDDDEVEENNDDVEENQDILDVEEKD